MRTSIAALLLALPSAPALAHAGPHLHPHGLEAAWALAFVTLAALAGALVWWRR